MHKTIAVLLGSICLFPVVAHAEQPATTIAEADNIKTLFFGHDDRLTLHNHRGTLSGNWKPPAVTCVRLRSFHLTWP